MNLFLNSNKNKNNIFHTVELNLSGSISGMQRAIPNYAQNYFNQNQPINSSQQPRAVDTNYSERNEVRFVNIMKILFIVSPLLRSPHPIIIFQMK